MLEHLLKKKSKCLYGNEVVFGTCRHAADLVSVGRNTTAFEIKSYNDDTRRLANQIKEYSLVFDFVYLVTTPNHLKEVELELPNEIGIIIIDSQKVKKHRKATQIKNLSKTEILHSIPIHFLKKHFKGTGSQSAYFSRKKMLDHPLKVIKKTFVDYLLGKLQTANKIFLQEKSSPIHPEDVALLSISKFSIDTF